MTSPDPRIRISPQGPRRPRFSFFHLHDVKELTSSPARGRRHWKQGFRILANSRFSRLPGSTSALLEIAEQWERLALDVVSGAGCIRGTRACQHPFSQFRNDFEDSRNRRFRQAVSGPPHQRWRVYMGLDFACQHRCNEIVTVMFEASREGPIPPPCQLYTRARNECHLGVAIAGFNRPAAAGFRGVEPAQFRRIAG